jgi:hypothetical protein
MDLTGVVIDLTPVYTIAVVVFVALGAMWIIRKVIKLLNKS